MSLLTKPELKAFLVVMLASFCVSSCAEAGICAQGMEKDQQYRVTFLELYDEQSNLAAWDPSVYQGALVTCGSTPLAPMASFEATALYQESLQYPGSCTSWVLEPTALSGAESLVPDALSGYPGGVPMIPYDPIGSWQQRVTTGGCDATWTVHVMVARDQGDVFALPDSALPPPVLVSREVDTFAGPGCGEKRTFCAEYWVGRVERVE